MAERIGACRCPLCGNTKAHASLTKKGLVCVTCNGCKLQAFARGPEADEKLRAGIVRADAPPPEPKPEPKPAAKPTPAPEPVQPPTQPEKTPPAARQRASWGWESW